MHVVDMFILISIGQVVGWVATVYAEKDHRRLGVHLIVTTIGAFIGGYLSLNFISETSKYSMIFGAFFVAALLLYLVRFRKWRYETQSDAKRSSRYGIAWPEMLVGKQITSIVVTVIFVIAVFSLLGWCKTLEIRDPPIRSNLQVN